MCKVHVVGFGATKIERMATKSIVELAVEAATGAMANLKGLRVDSFFVSNMLGGLGSNQRMLGAMVAEELSFFESETYRIEAACGSGGAAIRSAVMAIKSGESKVALVVGVEKMSAISKENISAALATASNWGTEGKSGESFISLNAKLMAEYIKRYNVSPEEFAIFSTNAHTNSKTNPLALYSNEVDLTTYLNSKFIHYPVRLYDASPVCDGAAAVLLVSDEIAQLLSNTTKIVTIAGSAIASNLVTLSKKPDLLDLPAVRHSSRLALKKANLQVQDIDFFELHDAYTIMAVLSLEHSGFVERGKALHFANSSGIGLEGALPISTMGGLKARGHAVGATGIYQFGEAYSQLTDSAGQNQLKSPQVAMTQNIGGCGAFVATHILTRYERPIESTKRLTTIAPGDRASGNEQRLPA